MTRFETQNHDYDGRPSCLDPGSYEDELLAKLFAVFGLEYAEELLMKDAAVRAAEAAAKEKKKRHTPELPS